MSNLSTGGNERARASKTSAAALRLIALASMATALPLHAQVTEPMTEDEAMLLPEVTVTANKIEQNVQDVPQSISVIGAYALEEKGIKHIEEVIAEIPNMTTSTGSGGGSGIAIQVNARGLNSSVFTDNNPVVIYIDGIPHSNRFGFDASMANVERIEVLRGPQGSLYGKDAIGAVINVVSRRPENYLTGQAGVEYGTDNTYFGTFNLSGALKEDQLYLGVNGQLSGDDGWVENTWPGMRKHANAMRDRKLGAFLLYEPHEGFRARFSLNDEATVVNGFKSFRFPAGTPVSELSRSVASRIQFDVAPKEDATSHSQALALRWRLPEVTIDSVTTHKKYDIDGLYDADFGVDPLYTGLTQFNVASTKTLTQELRVSNNQAEGLRWVAGLYLEREEHAQGPYGQQFPGFDPATGQHLGGFEMNAESVTDGTTQALFGQVIYPMGERFELTLGGRWQRIEKEIDLNMYYLPVGVSGPAMYQLDEKKTWNTFLPKAALSFKLNPQWTAYASYAKGYMPGGYNYFASGGTSEQNRFEPQTSQSYELGIKGSVADLTLAANVFYMDIRDVHVYKMDGNMFSTANARKAHSTGAELEARWTPARTHFEFTGALGIIDAEYDDYDDGSNNYRGEKIENTPSHTVRLGAAYYHPSGAYARLDVRKQGSIQNSVGSLRYSGYTIADAKLGWRKGDWEVYGFVQNLTDREYLTSLNSGSSTVSAAFGSPRKYGMGLRYVF